MSAGASAVLGCAERIEDAERPSPLCFWSTVLNRCFAGSDSRSAGIGPLLSCAKPLAALSASAPAVSALPRPSALTQCRARARFVRARGLASGFGPSAGRSAAALASSRRWLALARLGALSRGARPRALGTGVKPLALFAAASFAAAILGEGGARALSGWVREGDGAGREATRDGRPPGLACWLYCRAFALRSVSSSGSGRLAANTTGNLRRVSGSIKNGPALVGVGPSVSSSCRLVVGTANPAPLGAFSSTGYPYVSSASSYGKVYSPAAYPCR